MHRMLYWPQGEAYYVRVYAYNMKGYGPAQLATPICEVPSSWHDVSGSKPRYEGTTDSMHRIAQQLSNLLSHFASVSPRELPLIYMQS